MAPRAGSGASSRRRARPAAGSTLRRARPTTTTAAPARPRRSSGGVSVDVVWARNAKGDVTRRAFNARSQLRSHEYDGLDRPTKITTPEGTITFEYLADELQPKWEKGPSYAIRRFYDDLGRPGRVGGGLNGVPEVRTEYDLLDRPTFVRTNAEQVVLYEYDGAFLERVCSRDWDAWNPSHPACSDDSLETTHLIEDVAYDGLGRRQTIVSQFGTRRYGYDDDDTRDLKLDEFTTRNATVVKQTYDAHDALGNVLAWSATVSPGGAVNTSGAIAYDPRNRIAQWDHDLLAAPHDFAYDDLGNLTGHAGVAQTFGDADHPHRLTQRDGATYGHDDSGNLASITGGGSNRHFTFDSADRLRCIGTSSGGCDLLEVVYDAAGSRVRETAPGVVRVFQGADVVAESFADGSLRR